MGHELGISTLDCRDGRDQIVDKDGQCMVSDLPDTTDNESKFLVFFSSLPSYLLTKQKGATSGDHGTDKRTSSNQRTLTYA